jgi:hypothetical protein
MGIVFLDPGNLDRAPVTPAELEYTQLPFNARIGFGARLRRRLTAIGWVARESSPLQGRVYRLCGTL